MLEQLVVEPSWSFSGPLSDWCSLVMGPRGLRGDMLPLILRAGDLDFESELCEYAVSVLAAVESSWFSPEPALDCDPEDPVRRLSPGDVGLRGLQVRMFSSSLELSLVL